MPVPPRGFSKEEPSSSMIVAWSEWADSKTISHGNSQWVKKIACSILWGYMYLADLITSLLLQRLLWLPKSGLKNNAYCELFWSIIAITMYWHINCTTVAGKTLRMALANGNWHQTTVSCWLKWIWSKAIFLSRVVWTCNVRRQLGIYHPTLGTLIMNFSSQWVLCAFAWWTLDVDCD